MRHDMGMAYSNLQRFESSRPEARARTSQPTCVHLQKIKPEVFWGPSVNVLSSSAQLALISSITANNMSSPLASKTSRSPIVQQGHNHSLYPGQDRFGVDISWQRYPLHQGCRRRAWYPGH
jgi:hypothetical protein